MIKRIYLKLLKRYNPIRYAKKLGVEIGGGCKLLSSNFGSEPWLISIGNHVELSNGVQFSTHDGATWVFRNEEKYKNVIKYGKIVIEDNCFIGMNAIILPGVTIGKNCVIGAGSIVTKDIPANSVAVGNPARVISSISEYAEKCLMQTPEYDINAYRNDWKNEVLRIYGKERKRMEN